MEMNNVPKFKIGNRVKFSNCDKKGIIKMLSLCDTGIIYTVKLDVLNCLVTEFEEFLEKDEPKEFKLWWEEIEDRATRLTCGTVFSTLKKATKGYAKYLRDFYGKEN